MVQAGEETYKVRFPGVLNERSVQSEIAALNLLAEYGVMGIPQIVTEGIVDGTPYLVEYYINGKSLDKIYQTLSHKDWKYIAHKLAIFLQTLMEIQCARPYVFKNPVKTYDSYGDVIKESILRHLNKHTSLGIVPQATAAQILKETENINGIFQGKSTFLHFDIKPQNIIFDSRNKRVAFIDYEHSRMGDYTHELFRAEIAAREYSYFSECWKLAKQELLNGQSDLFYGEEYSYKLFYYKLFYDLSEMTYSVLIGDQKQIITHLNGIKNTLRYP